MTRPYATEIHLIDERGNILCTAKVNVYKRAGKDAYFIRKPAVFSKPERNGLAEMVRFGKIQTAFDDKCFPHVVGPNVHTVISPGGVS